MKKNILLLFIIGILISSSGCHFVTKSGDEEAEIIEEVVVKEPKFTLLDENDLSIYFENVSTSSNSNLWLDRNINYPEDVNGISQEILCSTIWNYDPLADEAIKLVFYMDNAFAIGTPTAGPMVTGNYEIVSDNEVRLRNLTYTGLENYYDPARKEIGLVFESNVSNLFYGQQLVDTTTEEYYGATKGESEDDRTYTINDIKIIKTTYEAVTTARLRFRTGPATSYESITVPYPGILTTTDGNFTNFLVGTKVNILARTINKETIGNEDDYWYFVSYGSDDDILYGWVYGAYTEEYSSEKAAEYEEIFNNDVDAVNNETN